MAVGVGFGGLGVLRFGLAVEVEYGLLSSRPFRSVRVLLGLAVEVG